MDLQWYDYLRMGTVLMALTACTISVTEAKRNWDRYNVRDRDYWWSFNCLIILMVVISINQIRIDADWQPLTLISFFVAITCLRAMRRGLPPRPPFFPERDEEDKKGFDS